MRVQNLLLVTMVSFLLVGTARARPSCITPDQALHHIHKQVCVKAHIYRIVDGEDGIHFLDVCSPETSDADCHFFLITSDADKKSVGNLQELLGHTIQIRGTVLTLQGHADIILRSRQQLDEGKKKFHPNPQLMGGFSAAQKGRAFGTRNGTMGQHGVHFRH